MTWRQLIILAAIVPATLYPILYAFRPWTSTGPGRALMVKAIGNLLLVDTAALAWIWPQGPFLRTMSIMGAVVFTLGLWLLLITLVLTPRRPPVSD